MSNFSTYCCNCVNCGGVTSKSYARANGGKCKACVTGVPKDISKHPLLCPDCREHLRTPYEKSHGYRCSHCVSEYDRETGYAEVRGYYGDGDY